MALNTDLHFSSKTDLWATPQKFFDKLNEEFKFTLDVCATPENAKCSRFYTIEDDGLSQSWTGTVWCNPPYGKTHSLFPLEEFKRVHFLVEFLSFVGDDWIEETSFYSTMSSKGVPLEKFNSQETLLFFSNKKWKNFIKDEDRIFSRNNPFPTNALTELSGLFSGYFSHSKIFCNEFNRRFMYHFNLKINSISETPHSLLTFSSGFSLMDAYTSFAIYYSCDVRQIKILHECIISSVKDLVKFNKSSVKGIDCWIKKGYESSLRGATVVMLIPSRTDTAYWHDYVMKGEIRFIRGRLKFGNAKANAPFPSAVVIFRP